LGFRSFLFGRWRQGRCFDGLAQLFVGVLLLVLSFVLLYVFVFVKAGAVNDYFVRENDDGARHRNKRGVARSLERGSSEVFYWELFVFRRPFMFSHRRH
jgi:hypothetical protein